VDKVLDLLGRLNLSETGKKKHQAWRRTYFDRHVGRSLGCGEGHGREAGESGIPGTLAWPGLVPYKGG
jgi:hypothetical protein